MAHKHSVYDTDAHFSINPVEVHYINMDSTNPENISADIYEVDDLQVSPDDSGFVAEMVANT